MLNALQTLALVRDFLDEQVVPNVAASLRSEVRAAIKLLAEAEREIDAIGGDLNHCGSGVDSGRLVSASEHARPPMSEQLQQDSDRQLVLGAELVELVEIVSATGGPLPSAQESDVHRRLATLLASLTHTAERAASWQSVFAPTQQAFRKTPRPMEHR